MGGRCPTDRGPAAWKQDYQNILYYHILRIWLKACGDTSRTDLLREVQRTLPYLFSNMRIMTTGGPYTTVATGAASSYTDTALTNGTPIST